MRGRLCLVSFLTHCCGCAGFLVPGGREREDPGGDQGTAGRHGKPRSTRRSAYNGVCTSPVLCARARRLPGVTGDARHPADAARMSARLRTQAPRQRRLQGAA